ncbi:MAG: peptidylprolyl isomerase [Bdellovibrionota bacterium]
MLHLPKLIKGFLVVTCVALISGGLVSASADLATVNGRTITDKDLQAALGGYNEGMRENILKDANSRRQILGHLIDQEVLVQQAEKEKLDQAPEYKEALAAFKRQYLTGKILEKNLASKITSSEVRKYYDSNKHKFTTDQVHAQHILVSTEEQARELIKKAGEPNVDFQELAEKHSKDPSAKNNRGDLGFFGRDRMVPEFTEAAFAGSPKKIVGPVKTTYGYHIIKVLEKKIGKTMEFDEVEMKAQNDLRQEMAKSFVGKLREQAKIQVNDKALSGK